MPNLALCFLLNKFTGKKLRHQKFSNVWTVSYNLACYCAQLGRLDECQNWFKRAMSIDELAVKRAAVDDPNLKPLWDSMSGTLWKRTE